MPRVPEKICVHGRRHQFCVDCGGVSMCECKRRKHLCRDHNGSSICSHGIVRSSCAKCSPRTHIWRLVRQATRRAFHVIGMKKNCQTMELLGCDVDTLRQHFKDKIRAWNQQHQHQLSMSNFVIDHVKPLTLAMSVREMRAVAHYSNLQPLPWHINATKGARWSSADEYYWQEYISYNTDFHHIYMPSDMPGI